VIKEGTLRKTMKHIKRLSKFDMKNINGSMKKKKVLMSILMKLIMYLVLTIRIKKVKKMIIEKIEIEEEVIKEVAAVVIKEEEEEILEEAMEATKEAKKTTMVQEIELMTNLDMLKELIQKQKVLGTNMIKDRMMVKSFRK
jgi:hypothetical protein